MKCDLFFGTNSRSQQEEEKEQQEQKNDGSAADSLGESAWPRGNVQLSAQKKVSGTGHTPAAMAPISR